MNDTEFEKRKARAANETLVIAPTEGGFRVYNPANITHLYMVSGFPDAPKCNCPDFENHKSDSDWRCKHIIAVLNNLEKRPPQTKPDNDQDATKVDAVPSKTNPTEKKKTRAPRNGHSQMLIKRSISPDGYINSLSVEFTSPVDHGAVEAVKEQAQKILKLQSEIAAEFLKANGNRKAAGQAQEKSNDEAKQDGKTQGGPTQPANGTDNAVPAQLLNIAGMDTKGGWKTFINVQVNGITAKMFGDKQELAKHITDAGFANIADRISQGMLLNLPCRVITKRSQDGKYLNIDKVFPAKPMENNGRRER